MKHEDIANKTLPCTGYIAGYNSEYPRRVTILEYGLADPSCSIKTIVFRREKYQSQRCSVEMVHLTEAPLHEEMLRDFQRTIDNCNSQIADAEELRAKAQENLQNLKDFLAIKKSPLVLKEI